MSSQAAPNPDSMSSRVGSGDVSPLSPIACSLVPDEHGCGVLGFMAEDAAGALDVLEAARVVGETVDEDSERKALLAVSPTTPNLRLLISDSRLPPAILPPHSGRG